MSSSSKKRKTASAAVQQAGDGKSAGMPVEYLESFRRLQQSWPKDMERLLDPSLPDERRSELWEMMCEGGDVLRQRCVIEVSNTSTGVSSDTKQSPRTLLFCGRVVVLRELLTRFREFDISGKSRDAYGWAVVLCSMLGGNGPTTLFCDSAEPLFHRCPLVYAKTPGPHPPKQ